MITNLHRQDYDGTPNSKGRWWVWKETCDRCGKIICDETTQHSSNKDALKSQNEVILCSECIRYLLDNDIPYKKDIILYKNADKSSVQLGIIGS